MCVAAIIEIKFKCKNMFILKSGWIEHEKKIYTEILLHP